MGVVEQAGDRVATVRPGDFVMSNVGVRGGLAPVRAYVDELLPEVLAGTIEPGRVFDADLPLGQVKEAYDLMDQRRAIKVMLRP